MSPHDLPILEYVREHPRATTREITIAVFGKVEYVPHAWRRCDKLKERGYLVSERTRKRQGGGFMYLWTATPRIGSCESCGAPYVGELDGFYYCDRCKRWIG